MRIGRWSTTAASNNQAVPDGAPEGWSPPNFNNWGREVMAATRSWYAEPEWLDLVSTPAGDWPTITRDSTTQFTVAGTDFTTVFTDNRRVRVVDTGGFTAEGHVSSQTFTGGNTEVVVVWEAANASGDVLTEDCPAAPDEVWVAPKGLGEAAFKNEGTGNGLDADTVDGQEASALASNTGKSKVINGRFPVWQRGTSFTDPTDAYTADRFKVSVGGSGAGTISRQPFTAGQTDVANEPSYFLRHAQTTGGTNPYISHRVEDVRTFAGQAVVFSYYAKVGSGTESVTAEINQNFGSGGSVEAQVTTSAETITSSWVRYTVTATLTSLSTTTIGTGSYLELRLELPSGGTFTFDTADWQLELGTTATNIDQRPFVTELSECQRYFAKTFDYDTTPASNVGFGGAVIASHAGLGALEGAGTWHFPVAMRDAPDTLTTYNPSSTGSSARSVNDANSKSVSTLGTTTNQGWSFTFDPDTDKPYAIHATAEAEL